MDPAGTSRVAADSAGIVMWTGVRLDTVALDLDERGLARIHEILLLQWFLGCTCFLPNIYAREAGMARYAL
jgi:hypothetical protein